MRRSSWKSPNEITGRRGAWSARPVRVDSRSPARFYSQTEVPGKARDVRRFSDLTARGAQAAAKIERQIERMERLRALCPRLRSS